MVAGVPWRWTAIQVTFSSAATSCIDAETSLRMSAPAATAARATSGLVVSMDTRPWGASLATTSTTRASSSSTGTGSAPGRVDSPPTSTTAAPSSNSLRPRATAASGEENRAPSENESGVTLTMPMTIGLVSSVSTASEYP